MIASTNLINTCIIDFCVEEMDLSDYFSLSCCLEFKYKPQENLSITVPEFNKLTYWNKTKWKKELKDQFLAKFADTYDKFCEEIDLESNLILTRSRPLFIGLYHIAGKKYPYHKL